MNVVFSDKGESAEVNLKNKFTKYGKNWQYFEIVEHNNRTSQIAIDLDTKKLVRGKASQQFLDAVIKEFDFLF